MCLLVYAKLASHALATPLTAPSATIFDSASRVSRYARPSMPSSEMISTRTSRGTQRRALSRKSPEDQARHHRKNAIAVGEGPAVGRRPTPAIDPILCRNPSRAQAQRRGATRRSADHVAHLSVGDQCLRFRDRVGEMMRSSPRITSSSSLTSHSPAISLASRRRSTTSCRDRFMFSGSGGPVRQTTATGSKRRSRSTPFRNRRLRSAGSFGWPNARSNASPASRLLIIGKQNVALTAVDQGLDLLVR